MNAARRKAIAAIQQEIHAHLNALTSILAQEEEAFENMPESLQQSERGEKAQTTIDNLQAVIDTIDNTLDELSNIEE